MSSAGDGLPEELSSRRGGATTAPRIRGRIAIVVGAALVLVLVGDVWRAAGLQPDRMHPRAHRVGVTTHFGSLADSRTGFDPRAATEVEVLLRNAGDLPVTLDGVRVRL